MLSGELTDGEFGNEFAVRTRGSIRSKYDEILRLAQNDTRHR